jgi:hypothetical protein
MNILRIKTPFAEIKLGDDIIDENSSAFWAKVNELYPNIFEENAIITTPAKEELDKLQMLQDKMKKVTEIKFYPEENKFEIIAKDEIVQIISSNEYFIENKKIKHDKN